MVMAMVLNLFGQALLSPKHDGDYSDYDFFFNLLKLNKIKRVVTSNDTLVYMQEGGYSSKNFVRRMAGVKELFKIHRIHTNLFFATYFIINRYLYKIYLKISFSKASVPIIDHLSMILFK